MLKTAFTKTKKSCLKFLKKIPKACKKRKKLCFSIGICILLLLALFCVHRIISPKPNDDIFLLNTDSTSMFANENPTFSVNFGKRDEPEKQWVRFEAESSTNNPFEEEDENFFSKIVNLFKPQEEYGIEMSLRGVKLSETEELDSTEEVEQIKTVAEILGTDSVETSTELIDSGRVIGEEDDEPVAKKTIVNEDVASGIDLEYQILEGIGLKEEIVIKDLSEYTNACKDNIENCKLPLNEFVFDLTLDDGLVLKKGWFNVDGTATETYYFEDSDGNYVAHFLPSFAVDNSGIRTNDVVLEVSEIEGGNYEIKVTVDINWLFSSDRVFPVRIDPSIVHYDQTDFDSGTYMNTEYVTESNLELLGVNGPNIDSNTVGYWSMDSKNTKSVSYYDYDTFDTPYPGGNDDWSSRNEVDPSISSATAYSGSNSLYMPTGWGRNFEDSTFETGQSSAGYDTNTYPYVCMAYKIPASVEVNMLIYIINVGWRSISLTQSDADLTDYAKVATWQPVIANDVWQYKCINLDNQLDASISTDTHYVNAVIWHTGGGTYTSGPFYIDEFIISNKPIKGVSDLSGNSNEGYIMGDMDIVDGKASKAMNFDGINDYVNIPNSTSLNLNVLTVECWFKSTYAGEWFSTIISKYGTTSAVESWGLGWIDTNTLGFYIRDSSNVRNSAIGSLGQGLDGEWHHLAGVASSTEVSFYIDGVLVNSVSRTAGDIRNTRDISFASHLNSPKPLSLDEIRISNIARSADEVYESYLYGLDKYSGEYLSSVLNTGIPGTTLSSLDLSYIASGLKTGDGETPYSTTSLVAQWDFNETSGTTAASEGSCGAACNGTLTGFSSTTGQDVVAKSGWTSTNRRWGTGGLMLDGASDRVAVTDNASLDINRNITIETWINPSSYATSNYNHIIDKDSAYCLSIYKGKLAFFLYNGNLWWYPDIGVLDMNEWYHVAVTYNGTVRRMYINGRMVAEKSDTTNYIGVNAYNLSIGSRQDGTLLFDGIIDSTRIYSRALSASEILSNYNAGSVEFQLRGGDSNNPNDGTWSEWSSTENETTLNSFDNQYLYNTTDSGLVSYWPMDEKSGASVADVKGSNTGTATGTTIIDGKYSKGRDFDGVDDSISTTFNPSTKLGDTFTISAWIKPQVENNYKGVAGAHDSYKGIVFFQYVSTSGWQIGYGDGAAWNVKDIPNLTLNEWHYIVGVYKTGSGGYLKIYVDGVEQGSQVNVSTTIVHLSYFYIGKAIEASDRYFDGYIDEVSIYNTALSSSTISSYYIQGISSSGNVYQQEAGGIEIEGTNSSRITNSLDDGLVSYWKMDESSGSTSIDSVGNNNGTVTGSTIVNGKQGNGRYFSASADVMTLANSISLASTDYTIETWFKYPLASTTDWNTLARGATGDHQVIVQVSTQLLGIFDNSGTGFNSSGFVMSSLSSSWHHLSSVGSGSTTKFYIDGVLVGTSAFKSTKDITYIGNYQGGTQQFGTIDEVKIYNIAKTADEILEEYTSLTSTYPASNIGLVSYWKMDESSGSTSIDSVGNNNGTVTGSTIVNGKQGNGRYFSASADVMTLANSISLASTDYTIETWFKYPLASTTDWNTLARGATGDHQVLVQVSTQLLGIYDNSGTYFNSSGFVMSSLSSSWHHLSSVGSGSTTKFYIDGVLVGTSAFKSTKDITYIGNYQGGTQQFGTIDEVKIYNIAKTADEIYADYNSVNNNISSSGVSYTNYNLTSSDLSSKTSIPIYVAGDKLGTYVSSTLGESAYANYQTDSNTIGLWHLDEKMGIGSYIKDSSGNGNDGIPIGTTYTEGGKIGGGRKFNGVNDYVSLPSRFSNFTNGITVSLWANPESSSNYGRFIDFGETNGAGYANIILYRVSTTNSLNFTVGNSTNYFSIVADNAIISNEWHYYTASVDNLGVGRIYRDGVLLIQGNMSLPSNVSRANCYIGESNWPSDSFYQGLMDEISISNVARTADQIRQAYEVGLRTHDITIDFAAELSNSNLVTSSSDTSFTVNATTKGLLEMGTNLYSGDKIILKETVNQVEYIAEGIVSSINQTTGATTVVEWDSDSSFPSGGFTNKATVFKWQKEYIPIVGRTISTQTDAISLLTVRVTNIYGGRDVWIDDMKANGGYFNTSGDTIDLGSSYKYFQYKAIFTTTDSNVSPTLNQVQLDFTQDGPSMEQIMRHGKWFSNGIKQNYWWISQ